MTRVELVDLRLRELPRLAHFSNSTLWWGVSSLIAIELSVFSALLASYFYLRLGEPSWPPPGVTLPDWKLPAIATVLLLISSYTMNRATKVAVREDRAPIFLLGVSVALAIAVDVIRLFEFADLDFRWDSHAYGSIFWTMKGLHFLHLIAAFLGTGLIALIAALGRMPRVVKVAIEVDGIYWQFVVWVWLVLFIIIYVVPRIP